MTATDLYQKYGVSNHSDPAGQIDAILTQKEQQIAACDILKTQKASIEAGLADIAAKQAEFARRDEEIGTLKEIIKERDATIQQAWSTVSKQQAEFAALSGSLDAVTAERNALAALKAEFDDKVRALIADPEATLDQYEELGSEFLKPEEKRRAAALDEKIAALQAERAEIPV